MPRPSQLDFLRWTSNDVWRALTSSPLMFTSMPYLPGRIWPLSRNALLDHLGFPASPLLWTWSSYLKHLIAQGLRTASSGIFVESKKYIAVAPLRKRESSLEQFGLQVGSSGFCSDYHPDMIAAE
jgi:hypothetical protein